MNKFNKNCLQRYIYRIIHKDNLEYVLEKGLCSFQHPLADPNYCSIGDSVLIGQRKDYEVSINPPNGVLGDYVPFYFGYRSPMLYNISTGYRGIKQEKQENIIYLCCEIGKIISTNVDWCFTNGHAKQKLTTFYNSVSDFDKVDWQAVYSTSWGNTQEDRERMNRKQAEFLVKGHIPTKCIGLIVVFNQVALDCVQAQLRRLNLDISTEINPTNYYYT